MASEGVFTGPPADTARGWRIGLWIAQVLLGAMFVMAGGMKALTPADQLMVAMKGSGLSLGMARFIGTAELAGAIGVVLPALTRICPILTPIAACGLLTVMILATGFNAMHGQTGAMITTIILGCIAAFVAWGRFKKAPIRPRA
ncbi:MAG TPA: DoxX family protein [Oscillatoriaceae cyanobacterium]